MARVRLSARNAYRRVLEDVRDRYVAALKRYGPAGGGLWARVARVKIKLRRWGGSWPVSEAGQDLTWFVRGTSKQEARPVNEEIDETLAQTEVLDEITSMVDRYDREAR